MKRHPFSYVATAIMHIDSINLSSNIIAQVTKIHMTQVFNLHWFGA